MPVLRYRDVSEVPPPGVVDVRDPSLLGRILALSAFASAAVGPLFRPGVTRFTSAQAADAAREDALLERMRRRGAEPTTTEPVAGDQATVIGDDP